MIKASDNPAGELVNGTMADPHIETESLIQPKSTAHQNSIEYRNQYVACDRANPACAASSQAAQGPMGSMDPTDPLTSMFAPTPVDTGPHTTAKVTDREPSSPS